jgi:hypothetical protein
MPDEDRETRYYNKTTAALEWRCKYCAQSYALSGGTDIITKHLTSQKGHGIERNSLRDKRVKNQQATIVEAMQDAAAHPQKRRKMHESDGHSINPDMLEILWIQVVVACHFALRLVEIPQFRTFLLYLNKDIECWLPNSHKKIRDWVIRQFKIQKENVQQMIHSARSKIHISCDLWTSSNSLAILGVVAHFVTEDGKLQRCVLALKDIIGKHTGENLAQAMVEVLEEWRFASKLGYFVMDNAENNDTMMDSLKRELARHWHIKYDPKTHRLRCQGHIINLAVQSFLFVTNSENIEEEGITLDDIELWRRKGPLGKLHNFVVFIQGSVQREQKFWELSRNRHLARDNSTRWNSWYTMLYVALKLRDSIEAYYDHYPDEAVDGDMLTQDEWAILEVIKDFLEVFRDATKGLESHNATLDRVLPSMDILLDEFEEKKEKYHGNDILDPMFNSGWAKMDKYYNRTNDSPAYISAIVLNPSHKFEYIKRWWPEEWHETARHLLQTLWDSEYKPATTSTQSPPLPAPLRKPNKFLARMAERHAQTDVDFDELDQYLSTPTVTNLSLKPISWWLEPTQQSTFPTLSRMAIDILSIPAMSAEPERLFSSAKITITDRRNHLESDIIEALECLKSWYNIPSVDDGLSLVQFNQLNDFTEEVEEFDKDSITQGGERGNCEA